MRRSSPVQQWLDSLPVDTNSSDSEACDNNTVKSEKQENNPCKDPSEEFKPEDTDTEITVIEKTAKVNENNLDVPSPVVKRKSLESGLLTSTASNTNSGKKKLERDYSVQSEGYPPRLKNPLLRDHSLQSDGSGSSGSSVLNVLGARKVDAESVLLSLGFGPSEKQQKLQRIPNRFLVPSKLKGIDTEKFIKEELHSMRMHECGIFGYRGLTGSPHVPPSTIVAKIIDCILQGEDCREEALLRARHSISDMPGSAAAHVHLASQFHNI